jgi:hypothetical protein
MCHAMLHAFEPEMIQKVKKYANNAMPIQR